MLIGKKNKHVKVAMKEKEKLIDSVSEIDARLAELHALVALSELKAEKKGENKE